MLAKHRMLISRLCALIAVIYVAIARPPFDLATWIREAGDLVGLVLLATAAFGRLWCLTFIGGRKNKALLTDGPYSVVRNPLYVFSFIGAFGFGLVVHNAWLIAAIIIWFMTFYPFTLAQEERDLSQLFGNDYRDYCETTPRCIPKLRLYRKPAENVAVNPVKIRDGILDSMWFIWAYVFWQILEILRYTGVLGTLI